MGSSSLQKTLDQIANSHSYELGFNGKLTKYRLMKISSHSANLPATASVFEIGAGEGPITSYLIDRFQNVVALEPAAEYFQKISRRFIDKKNVKLIEGLFEEQDIPEKFDLVISAGVLEHVKDPVSFLSKAKGLLKQGGTLMLTVPNAESLHRRIGKKMGLLKDLAELSELDHKVGHFRYYDTDLLRSHVESAGFKKIKVEGIMLKPFPNSEMDKLKEDFCDALFEVCNEIPTWGAELFCVAEK